MDFKFSTGIYHFHGDPNFNYQMNRWVVFGNLPVEEVKCAADRISSINDWKREFLQLALKASAEGSVLKEAGYYRAVDFFLPYSDPDKPFIYQRAVKLFREAYNDYFKKGIIVEKEADYGEVKLPVYFVPNRSSLPSKGTVVLTGGFDCYKEELIPVMLYFSACGYDFYYFEGPGQGEVLNRYQYPMISEWEKPVKAVLDEFMLEDVTLIGLSLGGYLALRAAAFDDRIKKVIAWGAMPDFFKVVSTRRGTGMAFFIRSITAIRLSALFNLVVRIKMCLDSYTFWGIDHGMHVMGVKSPYSYFKKLRQFHTREISPLLKQNFLLLAGDKDHFCDIDLFYDQAKRLVNVRSFTGRIFKEYEKAGNHCQFGNLELVLKVMAQWIENTPGDGL